MNNEFMNATAPEITPKESSEVMVINRADLAPADITILTEANTQFFCSIPNDGSRESQIKIYNAVNSKGESLADHKNEVLEIVDVACHPITLADPNTGEAVNVLRTILVDKNGKNYDAVSQGIVSSLQKIFAIVGQPSYDPPLKIKVVEQKTSNKFTVNTIELV